MASARQIPATPAAPLAHGLDGTLVAPDWPPITMRELCSLLAMFPGCGAPREILTVSPRPFSAASVVAVETGSVFIKRHHRSVRDREGLFEEHRFLAHLLARGAPVPRVLAAASGETAISSGQWIWEVHEVPTGVDLYADALSWTPFRSCAHARSAGEALARLHLASQGFDAPRRRSRPLVASYTIFAADDPAAALELYFTERPSLSQNTIARQGAQEALVLLAPFHSELRPLLPALPPLWTHNDLHASNLLWSDRSDSAGAAAVIDFGLADRTTPVHDLAHTIERNIVEWLDLVPASGHSQSVRVHLDHLQALLNGYQSVRPLSAAEGAALAPMTALCHAEFALSEADYFLSVLHSDEKARLASIDYLVGHAQWLRSTAGPVLLDAIHQHATRLPLASPTQ